MKKIKKAIVLDMDETLEHGIHKNIFNSEENGKMMTLRPGLEQVITKLKEAKKSEIDIILCTTAHNEWVERFLVLSPEFREIFDKYYTKDNEEEWNKIGSYQKPVETFGYDSILFIDDNNSEKNRLEEIYTNNKLKSQIDITYFSGFGFWDQIDLSELASWMEMAKSDTNVLSNIQQLLNIVRNEPGCEFMCSAIDAFEKKDFETRLTVVDEEYSNEYAKYVEKRDELLSNLEDLEDDLDERIVLTDEQGNEIIGYMSTDKKTPFENIERILLGKLVKTSVLTQEKLNEARTLEQAYVKNSPQKDMQGPEL